MCQCEIGKSLVLDIVFDFHFGDFGHNVNEKVERIVNNAIGFFIEIFVVKKNVSNDWVYNLCG